MMVFSLHNCNSMADHNALGQKGEAIAQSYLLAEGCEVIATNWRYRRAEVDIIFRKEDTLVFAEVKTRSTDYFGTPDVFVTDKKRTLMAVAANKYLEKTQYEGEIRFDIIAIVMENNGSHRLTHLKDAWFPGTEEGLIA